jgi:hypothetical protein
MDQLLELATQNHADRSANGKAKGKGAAKRELEQAGKRRRTETTHSVSDTSFNALKHAVLAFADLSIETAQKERMISGSLLKTFLMEPAALFDKAISICATVTDRQSQNQCTWAALVSAIVEKPPADIDEASLRVLQNHKVQSVESWILG